MNKLQWLMNGATLGAGLMYVLDPQQGKRRRALVRDKMDRSLNKLDDALAKSGRDLANRTRGFMAETRNQFRLESNVPDDDVLAERVRAKVGRVVSHPSAIEVIADQGRIRVAGPVLAHEVSGLRRAISSVRGVAAVEDRLEVHAEPGNVPGLQGEPRPRPAENWPPAARLLAGTGAAVLILAGALRRGYLGAAMETAGLTLLARAVTNTERKELFAGASESPEDGRRPGDGPIFASSIAEPLGG
jgi:hypothetical protein